MKMIRFVSVTASQIGSQSSGVGKGGVDRAVSKQSEVLDKVKSAVENDTTGAVEMENTSVSSTDQESWAW